MVRLRILGVRHHSPACARLVRRVFEELRPAVVLIEGPADMNDRLDELALDHTPPIAIFSHFARGEERRASWTPFTDFSPEWVALRLGRSRGATVRFINLPPWAVTVAQRRAGRDRPGATFLRALCHRLGVDGYDALWDQLFELTQDSGELAARLEAYFDALRAADGQACAMDREREAFMADHVAYAMQRSQGPVLVVCGGLHARALADTWASRSPARLPVHAAPPDARCGSYLVPFSFNRLDALAGYEAGVPSPGYYQALHDMGVERAADWMLETVTRELRASGALVSTADLIAADAASRALMRLRGRRALARVDVLDGFASALLDKPLDAPLPWTGVARAAAATDPRIDSLLRALRGERVGALDPATPRPPLVDDAAAELRAHGLEPAANPREVTVDISAPRGVSSSRLLHRLRVLDIAGFELRNEAATSERWEIARDPRAETQLAEAGAWGATVEAAAGARLGAMIEDASGDLSVLVHLIGEATRVGLHLLGEDAVDSAGRQSLREPRLDRVGSALRRLLALYRHDRRPGAAGAPALAALLQKLIARAVWLIEGARGVARASDPGELEAVIAIRDAMRHAGASLVPDAAPIKAAMRRLGAHRDAPPSLRGAAIGLLWATARAPEPAPDPLTVVGLCGRPALLGELLTGLFAVAREQVIAEPALIEALDGIIAGWDDEELRVALPALRLAFSYFPPRERDAIARTVLALHETSVSPAALRALPAPAEVIARGQAVERALDQAIDRYGLGRKP